MQMNDICLGSERKYLPLPWVMPHVQAALGSKCRMGETWSLMGIRGYVTKLLMTQAFLLHLALFFFFFLNSMHFFKNYFYLFIYGCVGSSFLCEGFL